MSTMRTLEDLFLDKLKDIHDAERRITKALPKMARVASSEELANAFQEHLQQTEEQIQRLDQIFESMEKQPGRKTCHGMVGLLEEGQELMDKEGHEPVLDAGLIAAAQEVEHYEIAAYGCLKTWANLLGMKDAAKLLETSLQEEESTDQKLNQLASSVNEQAMEGPEEEEEQEETEVEMVSVGTGRRTSNGSKRGNGRGNTSRAGNGRMTRGKPRSR